VWFFFGRAPTGLTVAEFCLGPVNLMFDILIVFKSFEFFICFGRR
jgi:hypothetical protein